MVIADFSLVYNRYDQLARHCYANTMSAKRGVAYEEFSWQPYKLLQAYAMGVRAVEERSIVCTPEWRRQEGATTTACALMLADEDVVTLTSDIAAAKYASRMVMSVCNQEAKNRRSHVRPHIIHNRVWWTSGISGCVYGYPRPKLVVVDSDMAYTRQQARDEAVEYLNNLGCAVLVLSAPAQFVYAF